MHGSHTLPAEAGSHKFLLGSVASGFSRKGVQ
jgi:hypothetical protein